MPRVNHPNSQINPVSRNFPENQPLRVARPRPRYYVERGVVALLGRAYARGRGTSRG
jgi:hypothetical protein